MEVRAGRADHWSIPELVDMKCIDCDRAVRQHTTEVVPGGHGHDDRIDDAALAALTEELAATGVFTVAVPADETVVRRDGTADPHLIVRYTIR